MPAEKKTGLSGRGGPDRGQGCHPKYHDRSKMMIYIEKCLRDQVDLWCDEHFTDGKRIDRSAAVTAAIKEFLGLDSIPRLEPEPEPAPSRSPRPAPRIVFEDPEDITARLADALIGISKLPPRHDGLDSDEPIRVPQGDIYNEPAYMLSTIAVEVDGNLDVPDVALAVAAFLQAREEET